MKDYNIENLSERINSEKTKEYFKEVSSSYFNGNYRAAIVTLYSVVINDILIKLETLEEIYNDATAKDILNEIKLFQSANPSNPDWEKNIIEKVKDRTNLIDNVDYAHIQALKNDRHLCAHPVIDKEDKLYTPNKEAVAAHIRNMMESLFLKPAILSKKILKTLLIDLADKKEILIDDDSVEKYIKAKYLSNLNPKIELDIFRDLWKFVFNLTNDEASINRIVNFKALYYIFKRNLAQCIERIRNETEFYSNISDIPQIIHLLIRFLSENEFLSKNFREDVQLLILNQVKNDFSAKVVAWFLDKSYIDHLKSITEITKEFYNSGYKTDASYQAYKRLFQIGISKGYKKEVIDFIIWKYSSSRSYYEADKNYDNILFPNLEYFSAPEMDNLCEKVNENQQVYGRNKASEDHLELKNYIIKNIDEKFEFAKYSRIFK